MADEYKTLREVGIGIAGIRTLLKWQASVFGFVVVVGGAVCALMFDKLDRLEEITTRTETKIDQVAKDTTDTRADIDDVKFALAKPVTPKPQSGKIESDLLAKFQSAFGPDFVSNTVNSPVWMRYETVQNAAEALNPEQFTDLQASCNSVLQTPASYSVSVLGVCAAVTNTNR